MSDERRRQRELILQALAGWDSEDFDTFDSAMEELRRWIAASPALAAPPPTLDRLREMAEPSVDALHTLYGDSKVHIDYDDVTEMLASYGEMLFKNYPLAASPAEAWNPPQEQVQCLNCGHSLNDHNMTGLEECYGENVAGGICSCHSWRPSPPGAPKA